MQANKYFTVDEIVSREVYELLGDEAIKLFDSKALKVLEDIREILGVPLICNNWMSGGNREYCGYREKTCNVGVPRSAHREGKAFDLISVKMDAAEMRKILKDNSDKLSCNVRIEDDVTWLHVDIRSDNNQKIYFFKA